MKILTTLLWMALVTPAFAQQYQVIAVGFYNLENLFDTIDTPDVNDFEFTPEGPRQWTSARYRDKLLNLAKVIGDMGTDLTPDGPAILGVAEIENRGVLEDLVRQSAVADRNYRIVHHDSPDARGVDVALLYQPEYFSLIASQSVPLHILTTDSTPLITRDILHVHGELMGHEWHILVNHWPSRRGGEKATRPWRNAAAARNREIVDSILLIRPDAGIIVMGDFNDDPVNASIRQVLRSFPKVEKTRPGTFYNPWHSFYKKGFGTLAYRDAWSLFDQILISHSLLEKRKDRFHYFKSAIVNKPYLIQPMGHYRGYPYRTFDFDEYISGYSDHFPTVSYFVKPVEP